jgi:hypothetical protein
MGRLLGVAKHRNKTKSREHDVRLKFKGKRGRGNSVIIRNKPYSVARGAENHGVSIMDASHRYGASIGP